MNILDARKAKPTEGGPSFSLGNRLTRALWHAVWIVFISWTPPQLIGWRRFVLQLFGAKIAPTANIFGSVRIWLPRNLEVGERACLGPRVNCYCMDRIIVEPYATVSQGAHLCTGTHDIDDPNFQLRTKPIWIGYAAWVAAEAFVGPGVRIGERAVLGARGVTFRDLEPDMVYIGNPACSIRRRNLRQDRP
jgi:putative colanic acid biosynthesis acetyltransferase WcaF